MVNIFVKIMSIKLPKNPNPFFPSIIFPNWQFFYNFFFRETIKTNRLIPQENAIFKQGFLIIIGWWVNLWRIYFKIFFQTTPTLFSSWRNLQLIFHLDHLLSVNKKGLIFSRRFKSERKFIFDSSSLHTRKCHYVINHQLYSTFFRDLTLKSVSIFPLQK